MPLDLPLDPFPDRGPSAPRERAPDAAAFPVVPLASLDTVWFQVAGTFCNLSCSHCFISCSPGNRSHGMLSLADVLPRLEEAASLGVREYYFTGGEPFLNPALESILSEALRRGPCTVLTNGLLIDARRAASLKALSVASPYSLDLRVSLDGPDAETNDAVRGEGTFRRVLDALGRLAAAGLDPVVTVTETWTEAGSVAGRERLLALLREAGLPRPRLKVMPVLRLGAEAARSRPYAEEESLAGHAPADGDLAALQCASGRMVTSKGVFVCPILIDSPGARLGATLSESLRPFPLAHRACHTCLVEGLSCRT